MYRHHPQNSTHGQSTKLKCHHYFFLKCTLLEHIKILIMFPFQRFLRQTKNIYILLSGKKSCIGAVNRSREACPQVTKLPLPPVKSCLNKYCMVANAIDKDTKTLPKCYVGRNGKQNQQKYTYKCVDCSRQNQIKGA